MLPGKLHGTKGNMLKKFMHIHMLKKCRHIHMLKKCRHIHIERTPRHAGTRATCTARERRFQYVVSEALVQHRRCQSARMQNDGNVFCRRHSPSCFKSLKAEK